MAIDWGTRAQGGQWIWKWPVNSKSGATYIVSLASDGSMGCSCPAWKFHRKQCKHIKQVLNEQGQFVVEMYDKYGDGLGAIRFDTLSQCVTTAPGPPSRATVKKSKKKIEVQEELPTALEIIRNQEDWGF